MKRTAPNRMSDHMQPTCRSGLSRTSILLVGTPPDQKVGGFESSGRASHLCWSAACGGLVIAGLVREEPPPEPELPLAPKPQPVKSKPAPAPAPGDSCHPSYQPCVPITSDVDCAGGSGNGPECTGRVTVVGPDEYGLDADDDGIGCEDSCRI
jgi:hypothetical protein